MSIALNPSVSVSTPRYATSGIPAATNASAPRIAVVSDGENGEETLVLNNGSVWRYITPNGAPILDVTKHLSDWGFPNAVPDVDGGGDAIQHAIDLFIANPGRWDHIRIPEAKFYTTKALIAYHPTIPFVSVVMRSRDYTYAAIPGAVGANISIAGAQIELKGDNAPHQPTMIQQGGRGCIYQGITFSNAANTAPRENVDADDIAAIYTNPDLADWVSTGCRTNRFSPCAAFAIDPFIDEFPGYNEFGGGASDAVASNRYPGLEGFYGLSELADPTGSSGTQFIGCHFTGGVVGLASSPPGPGSDGADDVQNNESNRFVRCSFTFNAIHYSSGQSQERANLLNSPSMRGSWIAIDDQFVGPGGNVGVPPIIDGAANIGYTRWIFNLAANGVALNYSNIYAEAFGSIGMIGNGVVPAQGATKFTGCTFAFRDANADDPNAQPMPFHLESWGLTTFDSCIFSTNGFGVRCHNPSGSAGGRLKFDECKFQTAAVGGFAPVSFTDGQTLTSSGLQLGTNAFVDGSQAFIDDPKSLLTEGAVNSAATLTITQDPTVLSRGTFTAGSVAGLAVGQFLSIRVGSPTLWTPQRLGVDQTDYNCYAAFGRISDITGLVVTVDEIPHGFPFGSITMKWQQLDISGGSTP